MSHGPEWYIVQEIKDFLDARGWLVEQTHGNKFQKGFPDLYVAHPQHGTRWVDAKNPESYSLTKAQRLKWPNWEKYRIGIWIMTAGNQAEYDKLFAPPNWRDYWKPSYDLPDIDKVLDAITDEADEVELHGDRVRDRDGHARGGAVRKTRARRK